MKQSPIICLLSSLLIVINTVCCATAQAPPAVDVRLVTDEAEAVLARWDKDLANFNHDLKRVEQFLFDVVNGKLTEEQIQSTGYSFFGTQGAWYTVGWKMAVLIEKTYGRARLIESFCDQRKLFATYNDAAEKHNQESKPLLALWSNYLIEKLSTFESK